MEVSSKLNNNNQKPVQADDVPVYLIRPHRGWLSVNIGEIWRYRELLYFFVWRDIKVRYKQTVFGFLWALLQPLLMMILFTLFFGILAKIPTGDTPYPIFAYTGLLPWTLFASAVTRASNSLVNDPNLIKKVYFPRLLMPLASTLSPLLDFIIAFIVLVALMLYFGIYPGIAVFWLFPFLLLTLMFALGFGLWFSAMNIEYRDIGFIIPFLLQLGLFASPVIYPSTFVPQRYRAIYGMVNPMSGIIEGFRWAILGTQPPGYQLGASVLIILIVLVSGTYFFRQREKVFADLG